MKDREQPESEEPKRAFRKNKTRTVFPSSSFSLFPLHPSLFSLLSSPEANPQRGGDWPGNTPSRLGPGSRTFACARFTPIQPRPMLPFSKRKNFLQGPPRGFLLSSTYTFLLLSCSLALLLALSLCWKRLSLSLFCVGPARSPPPPFL